VSDHTNANGEREMAERNRYGEYEDDWRDEPRGNRARGPQRSERYGEYERDDERRSLRSHSPRGYGNFDPESNYRRFEDARGQRGYPEEARRQQEGRGMYDDDWRSPSRTDQSGHRYGSRHSSPSGDPYGSSDWQRQRGQHAFEQRPWQSHDDESSQQFSDRNRSGGFQPSTWSYYEFWLIPGPHAGRGPQGYQRASERIKEDICDRLESHGNIDASKIHVQVNEGGEVTLSGTVQSRAEKRLADDVADSVRGVKDVHNQLRVDKDSNPTTASDPFGGKKTQTKL
jgi:hypothetical protein